MTKGTKIFRIVICVLLALTMIWSAICGVALILGAKHLVLTAVYDIIVGGVHITRNNKDDVLGDGTVYYDEHNNILTFNNATIESDDWSVYSNIDLNIQLIGENKFVCTNEEYSAGVYISDYYLSKDLAFLGDGSLIIEFPNKSAEAVGIFASDLKVMSDVTVKTSNCENKIHGIVCDASLILAEKASVTVNNGCAKNSVGVRVRGNALFEEGTSLNVSVQPGTAEICRGLGVSGDLVLGKNTSLEVAVDDSSTDMGECIRVSGLMEVGTGSTVTASSKNSYAVECFGSVEANKDAVISAVSAKKGSGVFCSGAVVNYGATLNGKTDALGGTHNRAEN